MKVIVLIIFNCIVSSILFILLGNCVVFFLIFSSLYWFGNGSWVCVGLVGMNEDIFCFGFKDIVFVRVFGTVVVYSRCLVNVIGLLLGVVYS